jgi:hypothetical protein
VVSVLACLALVAAENTSYRREAGAVPSRGPVLETVDRLESLPIERIHAMRGGSLLKEVIPKYNAALRSQRFWYAGKVFGRALVG